MGHSLEHSAGRRYYRDRAAVRERVSLREGLRVVFGSASEQAAHKALLRAETRVLEAARVAARLGATQRVERFAARVREILDGGATLWSVEVAQAMEGVDRAQDTAFLDAVLLETPETLRRAADWCDRQAAASHRTAAAMRRRAAELEGAPA